MTRAMSFKQDFRGMRPGVVVYADATWARLQTSGTTDVAILRKALKDGDYGQVTFRIPLVESGGAGPGDAYEREARVGCGRTMDAGAFLVQGTD
jgi:hypothetical protein